VARLSILLVAVLLLASCGGDDENGSGAFSTMLRAVPNLPGYRASVRITDAERIYKVLGVDRPSSIFRVDTDAYFEELAAANAFAQGSVAPIQAGRFFGLQGDGAFTAYERIDQYLGIELGEIDRWLETGAPPRELYALGGDFDSKQADRLLNECDVCDPPDRRTHAGSTYYTWGEDFEIDSTRGGRPPLYDDLGRGGGVAVLDRYALRALSDGAISAALDAIADSNSLADHPDFGLLGDSLDRLGPVTAVLSDQTVTADLASQMLESPYVRADPALLEALEQAWSLEAGPPPLRPYVALASGPGRDEDGPFTAVVLVHDSEDEARLNGERLGPRAVWVSELLDGSALQGPPSVGEIEVDGRVVRAKLRGPAFVLFDPGLAPASPVLLHE